MTGAANELEWMEQKLLCFVCSKISENPRVLKCCCMVGCEECLKRYFRLEIECPFCNRTCGCACGYKRVTSATDDPVAIELQALIEKYYNGGKYYKDTSNITTFYNGNKLWTTDDGAYENTDSYLTLNDIVMGKYGDLKLDLGWNCYDGVYSST